MADEGFTLEQLRSMQMGKDPNAPPEKPQDAGFLSTLGNDISNIPSGIKSMMDHPIDTGKHLLQEQGNEWGKAADSFKQGKFKDALSYGMTGSLPIIGPQISHAADEIGGGQGGQGAAHMAEAFAPLAGGALPEGTLRVAGAGLKGGVKAALAPGRFGIPGEATMLGAAGGKAVAGTTGAIIGGGAPFVRGAISAGREAMQGPALDVTPFKPNPGTQRLVNRGAPNIDPQIKATPGRNLTVGKNTIPPEEGAQVPPSQDYRFSPSRATKDRMPEFHPNKEVNKQPAGKIVKRKGYNEKKAMSDAEAAADLEGE